MSEGAEKQGTCVHCGMTGESFKGCTTPVCAARGMSFIPDSHMSKDPLKIPDPLIGRTVHDHLVVSLIGRGGFGRVLLALNKDSGLKVAIKVLDLKGASLNREEVALRNFDRESRALARLRHPSIVRLYGHGVFEDEPYLIMEYLDGGKTLEQEMRARALGSGGYRVEEVRSVVAQLLDALEEIHEAGLVHRDIKPGNLIIQRVAGNDRFLRLLDFGLAKDLQHSVHTDFVMGTPQYMAPEQLRERRILPATDLYALAVLAILLLTGQRVFPQKDPQAMFAAKLSPSYDPTKPLESLALPQSVRNFFRKALALRPEDRFETVARFRSAWNDALQSVDGHLLETTLDLGQEATDPVFPQERAQSEGIRRWLERERRRLEESDDLGI